MGCTGLQGGCRGRGPPEGRLLVHDEQEHSHHEVHRLTVADLGVVARVCTRGAKRLDEAVNKLNQNLNISAPTIAQRAGVAALTEEAAVELQEHVKRYEANRTVVIDGLKAMGITDVAPSQGAFYVYANLEEHGITDSLGMSQSLLEEVGVAMTPGIDFEDPASGLGERRVRISYPGATDDVREGMRLFKQWWDSPIGLTARGKSA